MTHSRGLAGQTALITGGSSGIGYHIAKLLGSQGARVAIAARRVDRLRTAVEEIRAGGGTAVAVPLDVSEVTAIEPAIDSIQRELGNITILINNAGTYSLRDALSATADDLDLFYKVNVRGTFLVAQAVGRRMIAANSGGRIINIASIAGLRPMTQLGIYGISKAAVIHMTKVLAREWGRYDINVCAVCPGYFRTEMTRDDLKTEAGAKLVDRLPRRRVGEVEDLTTTVLFLTAPGSRLVNGAIISVDDGLTVFP